MSLKPVVVDISHHNVLEPDGFLKMKEAGILGVIHKATEGTGFVDKTYAKRRKECEAAGLLWGAYHFARGGSPEVQVDHFLRYAKPDENTLLALDWEDKAMTVAKARQFLDVLIARTGRRPDQIWVYGGHVLRECIKTKEDKAYFSRFRLWLCHYTTPDKVKIPNAWETYGLWQYSESGHIAGIKKDGNVDLNVFGGHNLKAEWAAGPKPVAVSSELGVPVESKKLTPSDLIPVSRKARRTAWLKRAAHSIWVALGFDQIMAWFGIAQETRRQVEAFVTDHAAVLAITAAVLIVVALKGIEALMAEDVNEGRAVPSGGLPQKE